jgi:1D-myo-inositol 3-kinase
VPLLVVGHYCHDTILGNAGTHRALGGSAAYVSAVLDALGDPHEVVAKVGADFLYGAEVSRKPRVVPGRTTAFVDDYRAGERRERVEAVAPPIEPADLQGSYEVGVACGICGEVPTPTLHRLRQVSGVVIADAQSILRAIGPGSEVRLDPPDPAALACLDVLKASRAESRVLDVDALRRTLTLVLTDGPRGCRVLRAGDELRIEAYPAVEQDPTGAGDCFLAGLAAGISRGLPREKAARIGAFLGARAVEHVGVPRLTRAEARQALEAP